jgi:hypothetical protein
MVSVLALSPTSVFQVAVATSSPWPGGDFRGLVDIGDGRRLFLECRGEGNPTAILEAGAGNNGQTWDAVGLPNCHASYGG